MIAYNKEWLYNMNVRRQADEALQDNCISAATRERIYVARPVGFYQVGFWASAGFAAVTWLIIAAVTGLFEIMLRLYESSTLSLILGIACYGTAEVIIRYRHHYNSGIDNMLIWAAGAGLQIGLIMLFTSGKGANSDTTGSLIVFAVSGLLALRFADQLLSVLSFMGLLCFVYFAWVHGTGFRASAPYILILISAIAYFISGKYLRSYAALNYRNCLQCINAAALVALYACGNYFVVMELSKEYNVYPYHFKTSPFSDVFFWTWTFTIPVVYIVAGIRTRDLSHIRAGAILMGASILTFRYYHSVMSKEAALIATGIILTTLSYALIKYLETPKGGFTFQPSGNVPGITNTENIVKSEPEQI